MPIRNQIEAITQTLTEQPAFIYGTANERVVLSARVHCCLIEI
jgi:hypothetical protein